jgi:hypothetical protein
MYFQDENGKQTLWKKINASCFGTKEFNCKLLIIRRFIPYPLFHFHFLLYNLVGKWLTNKAIHYLMKNLIS